MEKQTKPFNQSSAFDDETMMDYETMMERLNALAEQYPFLSVTYLGESVLGRGIPLVTLGKGKKTVLYVGAHHGMEWVTSWILLRMITEYCRAYENGEIVEGCNVRVLFETRTLCLVPMLNPDGVEYQIHGAPRDHIFYDRVRSMNGGSEDFSRWQANARGVDLNHNYRRGFAEYKQIEAEQGILGGAPTRYSGECPESEPETGALCNYIRYCEDLKAVISFHSQGEEIYYSTQGKTLPESESMARAMARMCGYQLSVPDGMAAFGGLTDWCIGELSLPCFTVECGKGRNPLPPREFFFIYAQLRKLLFFTPFLT